MSWFTRLISKLFGSTRRGSSAYVWRRKGILRAASGSVEDRGYFGVDQNIFKVEILSDSARKVYMYLSRVADNEGYSFPFLRTIAKRTNLSTSTIGKALNELEKAGLLQIERRYSRRGGSSNLYHLRKVVDVYPETVSTPQQNKNRAMLDRKT